MQIGRPTSMTPGVISKLEEVFAIGGTDQEACFYADISHETLYKYQRENPSFTERKEALKLRPVLKARQTIVKGLDDPKNAQWYVERKLGKEFGMKQSVDLTSDGKALPTIIQIIRPEPLIAIEVKPDVESV